MISRQLVHVALVVIGVSIAQLAMKSGMMLLTDAQGDLVAVSLVIADAQLLGGALLALSGLGMYAAAAVLWLRVLQFVPLSVAYPAISLSYVLVYLGAIALPAIDESFSLTRIFGIMLIMVGVTLNSLRGPGVPAR